MKISSAWVRGSRLRVSGRPMAPAFTRIRSLRTVVIATAIVAGAVWPSTAKVRHSLSELRQNLFSICFVSEQEGLIVGDLARIFRTTDGGQTWDYQETPSKLSMVALSCVDREHVWAAGQTGQILFSGDQGQTWQVQPSGSERKFLDIAFANASRGLAVGDFGTILRTDDGGRSWQKVALPDDVELPPDYAEIVRPGDIVLYSVVFADAEHAWIVGEFGTIFASDDGGATWRQQSSTVESSLFGAYFVDAQRGWAVGLDATLLATSDGGETWQKQSVEAPKGFLLSLYDVHVRGTHGWAVGNSGYLLHSADAGATWQLAKVPVQMGSSWFRGVSLFPNGQGFIVGARGLVLTVNRDQFTPSKKEL